MKFKPHKVARFELGGHMVLIVRTSRVRYSVREYRNGKVVGSQILIGREKALNRARDLLGLVP
jgi:hypothetical protein